MEHRIENDGIIYEWDSSISKYVEFDPNSESDIDSDEYAEEMEWDEYNGKYI